MDVIEQVADILSRARLKLRERVDGMDKHTFIKWEKNPIKNTQYFRQGDYKIILFMTDIA